MQEVTIRSTERKALALYNELQKTGSSGESISIVKDNLRALDSATLIAVVGVSGTTIGAIIGGIFKVLTNQQSKQITIVGKSGRKLQFPANYPPSEIEKLVEMAKELDVEYIDF